MRHVDEHLLGASIEFQPEDMGFAAADAAVIYLEGYLFDAPAGPAIFAQAAQMAAQHQARIALSLSDPWCVDRHRADLRHYVTDHVDILFANEDEAISLVETDHPTSVQMLCGLVDEVVITRGPLGAVIGRWPAIIGGCHAARSSDRYNWGWGFVRRWHLWPYAWPRRADVWPNCQPAGWRSDFTYCARPHADLRALIKPLIC